MTAISVGGFLLLVIGSLLDIPVAVVVGSVALLVDVVHGTWARVGLDGVTYRRTLATHRVAWGEQIPMTIEVWNRKRLPLAWLRADDEASTGVVVRERELSGYETVETLRNAWTLAPFERVVRRFHVGGDRRGVFTLGPVALRVGDPLARQAAVEIRPGDDTFLVWPRTVPAIEVERPEQLGGVARARRGLFQDPARFAGVRPYVPGDERRRIHARTSARLGRPMTKVFEPSRERELLLVVDAGVAGGLPWQSQGVDEPTEELLVLAASLARSLAGERLAFGLVAGGFAGSDTRTAIAPVGSAPGQLERVLDLLARVSPSAATPIERLLATTIGLVRPGMSVLLLSANAPASMSRELRRLERAGARVVVLATGSGAEGHVAQARRLGLESRRVRLDAPWREASRLVIHG